MCELVGKLTFLSSVGIEGGSGGDTSLLLRENSIRCFHTSHIIINHHNEDQE